MGAVPPPPSTAPVMVIEEGGRGGVADYTQELAAALAARGQGVELITAADHLYPPTEGVEVRGWFHYLRPSSPLARALRRLRLGPPINALALLAAYPRCAARARRCRLVHMQGGSWFPLALLMVLMLRGTGTAVVHTPHNTFERGRVGARALRMLERVSSRTIVHARADLDRLGDPDDAVVIPHGEYVGLAAGGGSADRGRARADLGIDPDAPVTLVFGQLRPDKGIGDVLEAAGRVRGLVVLIAGEEGGGLAAAAGPLAAARAEGRVAVEEGFLTMADAARMFAAADTVTLAYRVASQSGVLMLSYGFARPVVVYPTGGLPEAVVDGETGWICARADPEALADALAEAVEAGADECRRRGAAGARLAREQYSWDAIARRTLAVYERAAP